MGTTQNFSHQTIESGTFSDIIGMQDINSGDGTVNIFVSKYDWGGL